MSGAWEILGQHRVLGAVLHTDNVTIAWAYGLRSLVFPGQFIGLSGMPYDMSRNTACMRALEWGASHVFMLDSDVIPPPDAVMRLLRHNLPVVSGMYCRRSPPHGIPVMQKPAGRWVTQFRPGSMVEVDVVGSGCLLIRRDVLEKLPPQRPGKAWFDWRVDMRGAKDEQGKDIYPEGECMSEDFTFCRHAREKLGIKIMVDTAIQCKHVGQAEFTLGNVQPLEVHVA